MASDDRRRKNALSCSGCRQRKVKVGIENVLSYASILTENSARNPHLVLVSGVAD